MATRIYFDSASSPVVSTAYSAAWDVTTNAQSRHAGTLSQITDNSIISGSSFPETSATEVNVLGVQFVVGDTIPDDRTIGTGTFSAVFPVYETNAAADAYLQIVIKVVSGDGTTERGVLYAGNPATSVSANVGDSNEEMTTSAVATRIYNAISLSSVNALTGDRIVIEVGARQNNTTTTSRGFFLRRGYETAVADYTLTSGITTTVENPWVEFSEDLFTGGGGGGGGGPTTRFYLPGDAPSVNPAFSSSWEVTSNSIRNALATSTTVEDGDLIGGSSFTETSASMVDVLAVQYTSNEQIPIDRTIGGTGVTLSAVAFMYETNGGADAFMQIVAKVVSADGSTERGILYAGTTSTSVTSSVGAVNEEFGLTPGSTRILDGVSTSEVNALAGDRIVIEIGARQTNTTTTSRGFFLRRGYQNDVGDYTLTSGQTEINLNPWVEFSQDIFASAGLVASAGTDRTVKALTDVTLSGSPAGGSGGYTHSWTRLSGPSVTLTGSGSNRTFKSPGVLGGTTLTFEYQVDDSVTSATDTVTINVQAPPIWFEQPDTTPFPGRVVFVPDGVTQPDPYPPMATISATKFKSYFATRIFPSYSNSTGGELLTNIDWLTDLGITVVSHKMSPTIANDSQLMDFFADLGAAGIESIFTMGEPQTTYTSGEMNTMVSAVASLASAGYIRMVTGRNEVNHIRGGGTPLSPTWAQEEADYQQDLYTRVKSADSSIIVGSPCLWSGNISTHDSDLAEMAPLLKDYSDYGVYHLYPRGTHPTWNLDNFLASYASAYDGKPSICTEAGYFAAANYTGGAVGVTEWAHDIYIRKMWLEYAQRGVAVSQFEFLCDPDASQTERESWFGLVETPSVNASSWIARPAYTNLQSVLTALNGGSDGTVGCSITTTGNVQRLAVNHAGGTKLFLWRRDDIESNYTPTSITPVSVRVDSVAGGVQTVNVSADVVELDI